MNPTEPLDIVLILKENGYRLRESGTTMKLTKSKSGSIFSLLIFGTIGILLLTFGLYYGLHFTTVISGMVFIGVPLIYERWRYPSSIIIDFTEQTITLKSGLTITRQFRLSDISSLEVDEAIVTSDVSPFKDGYQDFIYSFNLAVGKNKQKFLNLVFRQKNDLNVGEITQFFSKKLRLIGG